MMMDKNLIIQKLVAKNILEPDEKEYTITREFDLRLARIMLKYISRNVGAKDTKSILELGAKMITETLIEDYKIPDEEAKLMTEVILEAINAKKEIEFMVKIREMLDELPNKYDRKPELFFQALMKDNLEGIEKVCQDVFKKLRDLNLITVENNKVYLSRQFKEYCLYQILDTIIKFGRIPYNTDKTIISVAIQKILIEHKFNNLEHIVGEYILRLVLMMEENKMYYSNKEYEKVYG